MGPWPVPGGGSRKPPTPIHPRPSAENWGICSAEAGEAAVQAATPARIAAVPAHDSTFLNSDIAASPFRTYPGSPHGGRTGLVMAAKIAGFFPVSEAPIAASGFRHSPRRNPPLGVCRLGFLPIPR